MGKKQGKKTESKPKQPAGGRTGFGDKKLEGPNRPAE